MKKTITTSVIIVATSLLMVSCTGKKQNCDAYGSIMKIEKSKEISNSTASEIVMKEELNSIQPIFFQLKHNFCKVVFFFTR